MKLPTTINQVLAELDLIIEETVKDGNYLGLFAYVYRRTTAGISEAIAEDRFEDNARMEQMDVTFANFYIAAYHAYKNKQPLSSSWKASFEIGKKKLTYTQHLMLGMNAHINLDLGQAAALTCPGKQIYDLKNDFMEVNRVLAELTNVMQDKLGRVSPLMFVLDVVGGRKDEKVINFSMIKARSFSWILAEDLAPIHDDKERAARVEKADKKVAKLSKLLIRPPFITLNTALLIIRITETKNLKKVIQRLEKE